MAKEYKPEWVKNIEDWGKRMEEKYDSKNTCHSEYSEESRPGSFDNYQDDKESVKIKKPYWERNLNPVGDLVGQLISYLIATYVPPYFPGFFTTGWSAVYIVIVYSILVHVAVDVVRIFIKSRPVYYLGQVVTNIAGIVSMIVMVTIFPFNFPGNIGSIAQFALWVVIVIVSIVTIFDFFNIFGRDWEGK